MFRHFYLRRIGRGGGGEGRGEGGTRTQPDLGERVGCGGQGRGEEAEECKGGEVDRDGGRMRFRRGGEERGEGRGRREGRGEERGGEGGGG